MSHSVLGVGHADSANVQGCAAAVTRMIPKELQKALAAGEDTPEGARRLTKKEEKSILHPLLRLRQACCHPQVRPALGYLCASPSTPTSAQAQDPTGYRGCLLA